MTRRAIRTLAVFVFAAASACASAQTAAPSAPAAPAAPATPAAAPPKPECSKPGEYPGNLATDNQKRSWQKDFVAYVDCLKKFIEEQQALAEPHVKASNAAIAEYNAGVKEYNDQIQKAKGD
ncbi:MAG TPA: hypothetical protein VLN42_07200 [Casimicrobiaceae bacterium]|nr:hypothetical protein [Casimicrobiaceae bacterium]